MKDATGVKAERRTAALLIGALLLTALVGCTSDEERREEHLARAESYAAGGRDQEALFELLSALRLDPEGAEIHFRVGEVSERLGAYADAIHEYAEAQRLRPDYDDAALAEARLQIGGDPERAGRLIEGVLEREPDHALALARKSELALVERDLAEATRTVERALAAAPDDYRVHLQHGVVLRAAVRKAMLTTGEAPETLYRDALAAFERGIERMREDVSPPVLVRAWVERARVLATWPGHEQEAAAAFRESAGIADRWPERKLRVAVYRASLEWARGGVAPDLQRWALEGLLAEAPDDYGAWVDLARLEEAAGGSELAVLERLARERADDPKAQAYYARALDRRGRHAEAAAHLEAAVDRVDEKAIVLGTLVDIRIGAGETEAAEGLSARMAREFPDASHTRFAKAQVALVKGRPAEALEELAGIEGASENPRIQLLISNAELRVGNPDKALAALDRASELSGDVAPLRFLRQRARIQAVQHDWAGLLRTLGGIAHRLGGRLQRDDLLLLATALYETDRAEEGRKQLETLLALEDPPAEAALEFARRESSRDPERVRQVLERFGARAPADPRLLAALVRGDLAEKRFDAALLRIDAALEREPRSGRLSLLRAQVLAAKGDLPGAALWGRKALDLEPDAAGRAEFLARILARQGRTAEAAALLEERARAGALRAGGKVRLAGLRVALDDRDGAIELLEEALAEKPELAAAKRDLARLLVDRGSDLERAFALAQEARSALPRSSVAADTLGLAYLQRGLPDPAADQLREALDLAENAGETRPDYHYHLGLALRELGETRLARAEFEKALAVAVEFPDAERVRRALDELGPGA